MRQLCIAIVVRIYQQILDIVAVGFAILLHAIKQIGHGDTQMPADQRLAEQPCEEVARGNVVSMGILTAEMLGCADEDLALAFGCRRSGRCCSIFDEVEQVLAVEGVEEVNGYLEGCWSFRSAIGVEVDEAVAIGIVQIYILQSLLAIIPFVLE